MPNTLDDSDWEDLLQRIKEKQCTPFIGAGACCGALPLAKDIAQKWADKYHYPLVDGDNLARVAQFLAVSKDPLAPKELIQRDFQQRPSPDFRNLDEPHRVLADLELPIYITTNYDGFMLDALKGRRSPVEPVRELCHWNELIKLKSPPTIDGTFKPTPAKPLVYHLHGHYETPQSMVLTEDDYLEFLVRIERDNMNRLLPNSVRTALATTSLLFVGYSLADWNFRVLFRGLIGSLGSTLGLTSIAVQLKPPAVDVTEAGLARARAYLDRYFERIQTVKVRVYWGDAIEFARELRERWKAFNS